MAGLRLFAFDGYTSPEIEKAGEIFRPKIFISHGGPFVQHVRLVERLTALLGFTPIVVEDMPNLGLSVNEKVRKYMRMCRALVVLATSEGESCRSRTRMRQNVAHELGMLQGAPEIGGRIALAAESL